MKVVTQKLEWNVKSKIGSLDNVKHVAGGGNVKIFDEKYATNNGSYASSIKSGNSTPYHQTDQKQIDDLLNETQRKLQINDWYSRNNLVTKWNSKFSVRDYYATMLSTSSILTFLFSRMLDSSLSICGLICKTKKNKNISVNVKKIRKSCYVTQQDFYEYKPNSRLAQNYYIVYEFGNLQYPLKSETKWMNTTTTTKTWTVIFDIQLCNLFNITRSSPLLQFNSWIQFFLFSFNIFSINWINFEENSLYFNNCIKSSTLMFASVKVFNFLLNSSEMKRKK